MRAPRAKRPARRVRLVEDRRNPDFYTTPGGGVHPIRGTSGYDDYLAGDYGGTKRGTSLYRERQEYLKQWRAFARTLPKEPRPPRGKAEPRKHSRLMAQRAANRANQLDRVRREGPRRKSRVY